MQDTRYMTRNLIRLVWLLTIVLSTSACTIEAAGSVSAESSVIGQACNLIYEGKFEAADKLIKQTGKNNSAQLDTTAPRLLEVVDQYKNISQDRQSAQEAAYKEALAELEKLQAQADANDVNDANSADDIASIFSVIAKTGEFADEAQKKQLLSDSFVKEVMQKAIDKAAQFEVEGKWLEAYTNCYGWLVAIDPNNEGYSDYAQQLLDKATIAVAF